jgi:hypothetical protein
MAAWQAGFDAGTSLQTQLTVQQCSWLLPVVLHLDVANISMFYRQLQVLLAFLLTACPAVACLPLVLCFLLQTYEKERAAQGAFF